MKFLYAILALVLTQGILSCSDSKPAPAETASKLPITLKVQTVAETPRTKVVLRTHLDMENCNRMVFEKKDKLRILDACESYEPETRDRSCIKSQQFPAGTEVCVTDQLNFYTVKLATKNGPDVIYNPNLLMDADAYAVDDISGNCIPTMDRFLKDKKERISVPSDPSAEYYFIGDIQRNEFGNLQIATMRYGKSGWSFSGREISCRSWKFQYLVDGHCGSGSSGILRPLTEGSISSHIATFACNYNGSISNVTD